MSAQRSRPNSSRFPPLVSQNGDTSDQNMMRTKSGDRRNSPSAKCGEPLEMIEKPRDSSSSSANSNSNSCNLCKLPSIDQKDHTDVGSGVRRKQSMGRKIVNIACKDFSIDEIGWKIAFMEQEISTKISELKNLQEKLQTQFRSQSNTPVSMTSDLGDCYADYESLRQENTELKKDFAVLTDIVFKCQKHISKKDAIIMKLQEQRLQSTNVEHNCEARLMNVAIVQHLCEMFNSTFEEISQLKRQLTEKYKEVNIDDNPTPQPSENLPEKLVSTFRELVFQFWNNWITINQSIQRISNCIDDNDKSKVNEELQFWTESYDKLEDKYKKVVEQNLEIERNYSTLQSSIFETMRLFVGDVDNKTEPTSDVINNCIIKLAENCNAMKIELESLKKSRDEDDDRIYNLVQSITEAEIQLQLFGRSSITLKEVISNFIKHTCCTNGSYSSSTLAKLILQMYSNQLKWVQESNQRHSDLYSENQDFSNDSNNDDTSDDNFIATLLERAESKEGIKDEEEEDVDTEQINYILRQSLFGSTFIKSDLEVVEEAEEEHEDNEDSFSNDFTEKSNEYNECFEEDVKELLDDIISFVVHTEVISNTSSIIDNEKCMTDCCEMNQIISEKSSSTETAVICPLSTDLIAERVVECQTATKAESSDLSEEESTLPTVVEEPMFKKVILKPIEFIGFVESKHVYSNDNNDSALGSEDNCSTPGAVSHTCLVDDSSCKRLQELENEVNDMKEVKNKHMETVVEMAIKLDVANKKQSETEIELNAARDKIKELNEVLKEKSCIKLEQHLNDELNAWKELVEHQKAILSKMSDELQETQRKLKENENLINNLNHCNCKPKNNVNVETQTEIDEYLNKLSDCDNDLDTTAGTVEIAFRRLFDEQLLDTERESSDDSNENTDTSAEEKQHFDDLQPVESDECFSFDELPKSSYSDGFQFKLNSDSAIECPRYRRHSCQGRLVNNHYSKRKPLKLNKVEIIHFSKENMKSFAENTV